MNPNRTSNEQNASVCSFQILPLFGEAVRQSRQSGPTPKARPIFDEGYLTRDRKRRHFLAPLCVFIQACVARSIRAFASGQTVQYPVGTFPANQVRRSATN